jgi:sporulation protein YlmC with PRC-barrel domain
MDNMKHRRLQELDRSDFEINEGEPDIRGWDVRNDAGLKIGEVEELIVDAQQKKVRYMVVDLDDEDLKLPEKKVLVPIGLAELHKEDDDVLLPAVTVDQLSVLPEYDKDNLTDEFEQQVCTAFGRTGNIARNIVGSTASTSSQESRPTQEKTITRPESRTKETGSAYEEERITHPERKNEERSSTATAATKEEPEIGTADYYGNFYQHAFFNDYNLYKNRQRERTLTQNEGNSEDTSGLHLWELRHEGDPLAEGTQSTRASNRDFSDEQRNERIRDRRKQYEERRIRRRGNSTIIDRINNEGLQDA